MEDAIRRKLIHDGEGNGDDKRIQNLYRQIIKFTDATPATSIEKDTVVRRLNAVIDQVELSMRKASLVHKANTSQVHAYRRLYDQIEDQIKQSHEAIAQCKQELLEAKQIRKHKQEYDLLAQMIQDLPDRKKLMKELEVEKAKFSKNEKRLQKVQGKLDERKKQAHVFMMARDRLEQTIQDEDKEGSESEDEEMETS